MFFSVDKSDITNKKNKNIKTHPNFCIGCSNHSSNKLDRIYPNQIRWLEFIVNYYPLYNRSVNTPADLHYLHNTTSRAQHKLKSRWNIFQKYSFLDKLSFIQDNSIGVRT